MLQTVHKRLHHCIMEIKSAIHNKRHDCQNFKTFINVSLCRCTMYWQNASVHKPWLFRNSADGTSFLSFPFNLLIYNGKSCNNCNEKNRRMCLTVFIIFIFLFCPHCKAYTNNTAQLSEIVHLVWSCLSHYSAMIFGISIKHSVSVSKPCFRHIHS